MPEKQSTVSKRSAPSTLPTLEFRIPISPTDSNMRMVRYFLESVRHFGGPIARSARTVLSVGDKAPPFDLSAQYPWTRDHNIEIHWVEAEQFAEWQFDATGFDRFWIRSEADVVAKIDADLLVTGDFDDIVLQAHREQKVLGFMAHVSPFSMKALDGRSSAECWAHIYHVAGLEMPELKFQYSAWDMDFNAIPGWRGPQVLSVDPAHRYGPAYYNAGLMVGPRDCFDRMGTTIVQDIEMVNQAMGKRSIYSYQIANSVCCDRHGIDYDTVSINYNFPMNLPTDLMRALNPDPEGHNRHEDTKIFHYIGGRKFFESPQSVLDLLADDTLDGAWPVFQDRLRKVHEIINAPPPRPTTLQRAAARVMRMLKR